MSGLRPTEVGQVGKSPPRPIRRPRSRGGPIVIHVEYVAREADHEAAAQRYLVELLAPLFGAKGST
jgi:hypothetical protein